ncbi:SLC13 family permease, partial [Natronospira sp.]|uniref:SLC13 family permease n=1 Tax=Natronospira sp. TaxID=2024970 RepID=UPI0038736EB6
MTIEILFVLALVAMAVALFASEKLPVDMVALIIMAVLLLSGVVSPEEGIAGFSNTATVTVAAMFVISAALFRTGAVETLGRVSARVFQVNLWAGLVVMMITVGVMSAFINNTP